MTRGAQSVRSWTAGSEDRRARRATEKGASDREQRLQGREVYRFTLHMESHLGWLVERSVVGMVPSRCLQEEDCDLLRNKSSTLAVILHSRNRSSRRHNGTFIRRAVSYSAI